MESKTTEADKKPVKEEKEEKKVTEEKEEMSQTPITKNFETLVTNTGTECSIISGGVNYII